MIYPYSTKYVAALNIVALDFCKLNMACKIAIASEFNLLNKAIGKTESELEELIWRHCINIGKFDEFSMAVSHYAGRSF